jgi:hypothetical protein
MQSWSGRRGPPASPHRLSELKTDFPLAGLHVLHAGPIFSINSTYPPERVMRRNSRLRPLRLKPQRSTPQRTISHK